MADLITIDDVSAAFGREPEDAEEEALWAFYISIVSDYINEYVSVSFFLVEGEVKRFKASYSGEIQLVGPVHQVTDVVNFRTLTTSWWADWDGMNTIFGLEPQEVVDVTYTYGYTSIPSDIVNLATSAVVRLAGGEETSVDLRSHQVGDVRDEYRDNGVAQLLGSYGSTVLAKYSDDTFTIDTSGSGRYPNYMSNQIPTPAVSVGDAPTLTGVDPVEIDEDTPFAITFAGENWRDGVELHLEGVAIPALFDLDAGTGSAFLYSATPGTFDLTVVNPDGQESDATEITINVVISGSAPDAPENLVATDVTESTADLSWDSVSGADYYSVDKAVGAGAFTFLELSLDTLFTDIELTADSEYHYRVRAVNAAGEGAYSNELDVTTDPLPTVEESIWPHDKRPPGGASGSGLPAVLGTRFSSSLAGDLTKVCYYKGGGQVPSSTMKVWTNTGTLLDTVSMPFMDTATEGWHIATLSSPIAISAATNYVVSYNNFDDGSAACWTAFQYAGYAREEGVVQSPVLGGLYDINGDPDVFPATAAGDHYMADVVIEVQE